MKKGSLLKKSFVLLASVLLFSIAGCGDKDTDKPGKQEDEKEEQEADKEEERPLLGAEILES